MQIELNPEQLSYIKGLDSKKKQRKFLLDCILENIIGESRKSVKIYDLPVVEKCEICHRYPKIENSNKCESCHNCIKHIIANSPIFNKEKLSDRLKERQEYTTDNFDFNKGYRDAIERNGFFKEDTVAEKVDLSKELYLTYIGTDCNSFCVRVLDFEELSGFTMTKFRFEESSSWSWKSEPQHWRKSTPEEIKSMLIKKLEADGLKVGSKVDCSKIASLGSQFYIQEIKYKYWENGDMLTTGEDCILLYSEGKFATIIPQENNELVNLTDEIKNIEVDFENVSQKENPQ